MTQDEQLTVDLWLLDAMLTGHDSRSGRGDLDKIITVEEFYFGEIFYLSDGGYSRVLYSDQNDALCLTSNSTDEVKALWHKESTKGIRWRIEQRVKQWLKQQKAPND